MLRLSMSALMVLLASQAAAQGKVQIRQNTNVKKDVAKPAFVSLTLPESGQDVFQIGVGVLLSAVSKTLFDLDALVDYQRDNSADDEQNVFKAGATGEWRLWEMSSSARHQTAALTFRTDFKRDVVELSKGWQVAVGYTHLFSGQRSVPLPNLPYRFGGNDGWLEIVYFPAIGLELEDTYEAEDPGDEGVVMRPLVQLSTALYPLPLQWRQRVETILTYAYRHDAKDSTAATDDSHPFFTFEVNGYLLKAANGEAGLGVSYTRGENPDEGLKPTNEWQISFKVRLK